MGRRKFNNLQGVLSAPLTDSATSFSSLQLSEFPVVVAPDYAVVVFNPTRDATKSFSYEIAWVTAHSTGSPTATISRGHEDTVALAFPLGTRWHHAATALDFAVFASGGGGGGSLRETPTGVVDGTNFVFGVSAPINSGSSQVFLNGLLLDELDYVEGSSSVILSDPPSLGDRLTVVFVPS